MALFICWRARWNFAVPVCDRRRAPLAQRNTDAQSGFKFCARIMASTTSPVVWPWELAWFNLWCDTRCLLPISQFLFFFALTWRQAVLPRPMMLKHRNRLLQARTKFSGFDAGCQTTEIPIHTWLGHLTLQPLWSTISRRWRALTPSFFHRLWLTSRTTQT